MSPFIKFRTHVNLSISEIRMVVTLGGIVIKKGVWLHGVFTLYILTMCTFLSGCNFSIHSIQKNIYVKK